MAGIVLIVDYDETKTTIKNSFELWDQVIKTVVPINARLVLGALSPLNKTVIKVIEKYTFKES